VQNEAKLIRASQKPAKQQIVPGKATARNDTSAPKGVEAGRFVVQLGAYGSIRSAERGWNRIAGQVSELKSFDPQTARVHVRSVSLFRLSVAGFTSREVAGQVCTRIKASGGDCFIRSLAGDTPLQWALNRSRGGTRIASARR
jgi:cell division protein FtsN